MNFDKVEIILEKRKGSVLYKQYGFPSGISGEESTCQCRRHKRCRFDPYVGKIPWRREWQPTPVFLPEKSHGWAAVHGVTKSWSQLSGQHIHTCKLIIIIIIIIKRNLNLIHKAQG